MHDGHRAGFKGTNKIPYPADDSLHKSQLNNIRLTTIQAMEDEGDNGLEQSEMFDISTLSEAEKRRLRRRQRILGNQGARLNRILNNDNSDLKEGDSKIKLETNKGSIAATSNVSKEEHNHKRRSSDELGKVPQFAASIFQELSGSLSSNSPGNGPSSDNSPPQREDTPKLGLQDDGTVILPKISEFYGHVMICCLAVFLSLLNAKRYVVTFVSWEIAYYFLNGLPPLPPPNMLILLAAVMGMKEGQLNRLKMILHFCNCVIIDFSLFLTFTLLPHVIRSLLT